MRCYSTRRGKRDYFPLKNTLLHVSEKVEVKAQAYPRLDSAGAMVVEPDVYALRAQLLVRGQVAHGKHHAPGLQHSESQFT